jgi:hypothetical protein
VVGAGGSPAPAPAGLIEALKRYPSPSTFLVALIERLEAGWPDDADGRDGEVWDAT